jgi:uncharacterized flavoprotein (TIGR03862 family)
VSTPQASAIIIGGGPGGLMAAEVLAATGVQVDVYEHMPSVGRKLLLAGRGGLNITHSEPTPSLLARYGNASPRLATAVQEFDATALRAWCAGLGEATFVGSSGRVFPQSFRATPLLRAWLRRLDELGVRIHTRHRWVGWATDPSGGVDARVVRVLGPDGTVSELRADVVLLALGGASWPRVGSDGGWVSVLRDAGIEISELRAANGGVRIEWSPPFAARFAGTPLKNVAIGAPGVTAVRGDAMITAPGLEGGPIYAIGAAVRRLIDNGGATLSIDLQPDLTHAQIDARLSKRRPKDSTTSALRRALALAPAALAVMREATANVLPTDADALADLVKATPLRVVEMMPIERAISTAGGVALAEVDGDFMLQRLPGTFVAGEMLDWEAPTGGYLLQATFSTAVAAAGGALRYLANTQRPRHDGAAGR